MEVFRSLWRLHIRPSCREGVCESAAGSGEERAERKRRDEGGGREGETGDERGEEENGERRSERREEGAWQSGRGQERREERNVRRG